ncbi:jg13887 [Pararge aegeria aegeria]|uniref:Jg13887 protein n=1 Tax=Pararge aegeria aegeria TaxID=348720 RepID=A0A8S4S6A3_9NEOP|nr:jg13887 [Pararge aegeria aegeria]
MSERTSSWTLRQYSGQSRSTSSTPLFASKVKAEVQRNNSVNIISAAIVPDASADIATSPATPGQHRVVFT